MKIRGVRNIMIKSKLVVELNVSENLLIFVFKFLIEDVAY